MLYEEARAHLADLSVRKSFSKGTLSAYERDLRQFCDYAEKMGVTKLRDTSRAHVAGYLTELRALSRTPATLSRTMVSLRTLYRHLLDRRVVDRDPTYGVELPKPQRKQPDRLTVDEVARLLDAPSADTEAGLRDRAMLETMYATGLRVSELLSLNEGDVDLEMRYARCLGPQGNERIVPLTKVAAERIAAYMMEARPQFIGADANRQALFVNRGGERLTRQAFWKAIKRYALEAGIRGDVSPHTLRHSFAYHLLEGGADIRSVQELLGHAGIGSTQMYASAAKPRMRDVHEGAHPRSRPQT